MFTVRSLIPAFIFGFHTVLVQAQPITINFIEAAAEGPTTVSVTQRVGAPPMDAPVPACAPGVLPCVAGGIPAPKPEGNALTMQAPLALFPGLPATGLSVQAVLIEPAGVPGEVAGAISDIVSVSMRPGANFVSIAANFLSIPGEGANPLPPGFPAGLAVTETGGLQNLSANFFTGGFTPNAAPIALPANLIIRVQSDLAPPIPEPETYVMFMAGLGLMSFIARCRRKNGQA